MMLIADSGSTKTDWCFVGADGNWIIVQTDGMNPVVQTDHEIAGTISGQLIAQSLKCGISPDDIDSIRFYGAGCLLAESVTIRRLLADAFPRANDICVYSDLLAACHALCGHTMGIVCILGTGANSCLYDGANIVEHTPALGYILGDEGSGAVLGRMFLNGILKGGISPQIRDLFYEECSTSMDDIIRRVYHSPMPNRYLASLSRFISHHVDDDDVRQLVIDNFVSFIRRNVMPYCNTLVRGMALAPGDEIRINAVGGIAFYYRPELEQAARQCGFSVGDVVKSPLERLVAYYQEVSI